MRTILMGAAVAGLALVPAAARAGSAGYAAGVPAYRGPVFHAHSYAPTPRVFIGGGGVAGLVASVALNVVGAVIDDVARRNAAEAAYGPSDPYGVAPAIPTYVQPIAVSNSAPGGGVWGLVYNTPPPLAH